MLIHNLLMITHHQIKTLLSDVLLLSDSTTSDQLEFVHFEPANITESSTSDVKVLPTSCYPRELQSHQIVTCDT